MSHPTPDVLRASQTGTLPEALQLQVASHLGACGLCQALVDALDDASVEVDVTPAARARILARIRAEVGQDAPRRRWLGRWIDPHRLWQPLPLAAGLAAVLAIGAVAGWWWQQRAIDQTTTVADVAQAPPTPSVLRLEKATVRPPRAAVLVWRGSEDEARSEVDDLARALEPYGKEDYADAATRLAGVVRRHPRSAAGQLYLGVSLLFLQRDAEARAALEAAEGLAEKEPDVASEAAWYLALACHRTGQLECAAARLQTLCAGKGERAARACAGLAELPPRRPPRSSEP